MAYRQGDSIFFIQSQTATSSASLIFTGGANYYITYFLTFTALTPATNAATLQMQMSNNGGSSYITTGYTGGVNYDAYNATTLTNANSTSAWQLTGPVTTNSNGMSGQCYIFDCNIGSAPQLTGAFTWFDNVLSTVAIGQAGGWGGSSGANAFKIFFSTGNIANGTVSLYGVRIAP